MSWIKLINEQTLFRSNILLPINGELLCPFGRGGVTKNNTSVTYEIF